MRIDLFLSIIKKKINYLPGLILVSITKQDLDDKKYQSTRTLPRLAFTWTDKLLLRGRQTTRRPFGKRTLPVIARGPMSVSAAHNDMFYQISSKKYQIYTDG